MGSANVQGELWGRKAQAWATGWEARMLPLYVAALDALEPLTDQRFLDVGCGAGLVVRTAADRGAVVSGLDASGQLLDVAKERTPDADLQVGDNENLPYEPGTFDVVTAFNSIQYAANPANAVAELARVCRPGGRVAIAIWGDAERCETEALFARLRSLAPPPPGTPSQLTCSGKGVVEKLMEKAGLQVRGGAEVPIPIQFTDHTDAWNYHTASGPLQRVIDVAGADAVRRVLHDVLEGDRKPDGSLRQDNVMRYVIAVTP